MELLVTPAIMLDYRFKLETNNWKRIVKLKSRFTPKSSRAMMTHKIREKSKKTIGTSNQTRALDFFGIINSFLINFNPSSMGCNEPNQPTFYGPVLLWIMAIIKRSNKTK